MFRPTWKCGLMLLLLGVPLPAQETKPAHDPRLFQSPQEQRALAADLQKLLDPEQDVSKAKRQYQFAKGRHPQDPRVDYAMGLVLLKHFDYEEAGKQFQAATEGDRIQYLPAWQAVIHLDILQKDREHFLADTLKLAKLAANPNAEWVGKDQPLGAAAWLGEVCEYLKLPGVDFLEPAQHTAHVEKLTELMTPEQVAAWVEGQPKLRGKFVRLFNEIRKQQQEMKAEIEQTANRKTARLTDRKKDINQKKDDARKSEAEWKAWYDKQMKQTESQLKTLQKDFAALDTVARRLKGLMAQTQLEIGQLGAALQLQQQNGGTANRTRQFRANVTTQIRAKVTTINNMTSIDLIFGQRQQELLRYQLQYAALEQKGRLLTAQARQVVALRQQAALQYKNATGEIVRADKTLDRWEKVVEKSSLKAAAKAENADPLEALEKRRMLVSSYFPLDFDTEKTRVLKSYESP